jgi:hypothetical protein
MEQRIESNKESVMNIAWTRRAGLRAAALIATGGTVLGTSCGTTEIRAIVTGVEAAAAALDSANAGRNNDITFGEWLLSEIN